MAKKVEKKEKVVKAEKKNSSVRDMKFELQKLILDVKSGVEKNTTKVKLLKKDIARKLTEISLNKTK